MKLFTVSELTTLLAAAGTSLEEVAATAAKNANQTVASTTVDIEHDERIIRDASERIARSKFAQREATRILSIASRV